MTSKKEQKIAIALIKDDLVNRKLLIGLRELGLQPSNYFLNLSETIFYILGFPDDKASERVFEHYLELTKKVKSLNIAESHIQLDNLTQEIYLELIAHRTTIKK